MGKKEAEKNYPLSHPFDKSFKVIIDYCPDLAFDYLNLPGKYDLLCKNNFIGTNLKEYCLDSVLHSMHGKGLEAESFLINLEHQSTHVTLGKLKTMNMYSVHASYYFAHPVVSLVLTDVDSYNRSVKEYKIDEDIVFKPRYIYFSLEEINEKLANLKKKHDLKETLSDMEAMDVAFLPIIAPRHMRKEIAKNLVKLSHELKIENERIDCLIVNVMTFLLKYYFEGEELIELTGMMKMGFEEAVDKLFNGRLNELNHELYQSHELLEMSNKERDTAVSNAKQANKEREKALKQANKERDNAKMAHKKVNQLTQTFKELIKQGKLTEEDLASVGITL